MIPGPRIRVLAAALVVVVRTVPPGGGRSWPTTAFFAASGKLTFTHIGSYATEAKLDEDITRYALHG